MSSTKHPDLVVASDGLVAREARFYTTEKLNVLTRYCTMFNRAMKSHWPTRIYIELLSGLGRYVIRDSRKEIDGSSLVAAAVQPAFTHMICNDYDPSVIQALQQRMANRGHANVTYENGDCNLIVPTVLRHLQRMPRGLTFCFIDTTNWQMHFESVRQLTEGRRMDLLVLFHSTSMKRVASLDLPTLRNLSLFFGDDPMSPTWKTVYERAEAEGRSRSEALLDHYKYRLKTIGYDHTDHQSILMNVDSGGSVYQLLFASKSPLGKDFFQKTISRTASGQRQLVLLP